VVGEHVLVVLDVLAELPARRVRQPRREGARAWLERQLVGNAG
jgi:hypothetical protein